MSVTLSSADVGQLETAQMLLLSPLDHESLTHWRVAVRVGLTTLLSADHAASLFSIIGEPRIESSPELVRACERYFAHNHTRETGLDVWRREPGLEQCNCSPPQVFATLAKMEIRKDWSRPHGLLAPICVRCDFDPSLPPAGFWFYHPRESSPPFGRRGLVLLQLLLPALRASAHVVQQVVERCAAPAQLIDRLPECILVASATERVLHEMPAQTQTLVDDPEHERVLRELMHSARGITALAHRVERPRSTRPQRRFRRGTKYERGGRATAFTRTTRGAPWRRRSRLSRSSV